MRAIGRTATTETLLCYEIKPFKRSGKRSVHIRLDRKEALVTCCEVLSRNYPEEKYEKLQTG
jgi:hypothetical protein